MMVPGGVAVMVTGGQEAGTKVACCSGQASVIANGA